MRRVIGIGSPFGADQLGWQAIDLLHNSPLGDCELIKLDRPGSDLIRYFEAVDDLVLIDAVQSDQTPGSPLRLDVADLSSVECRTSTHGFGVAEALQMAEQLALLPDKLLLIGIETGPDLTHTPEIRLDHLLSLLKYQAD
ncbi:MAG: hydrogenase maturation protease [Pseudomonadota bacterium]